MGQEERELKNVFHGLTTILSGECDVQGGGEVRKPLRDRSLGGYSLYDQTLGKKTRRDFLGGQLTIGGSAFWIGGRQTRAGKPVKAHNQGGNERKRGVPRY